jgi:hypothetical protein
MHVALTALVVRRAAFLVVGAFFLSSRDCHMFVLIVVTLTIPVRSRSAKLAEFAVIEGHRRSLNDVEGLFLAVHWNF